MRYHCIVREDERSKGIENRIHQACQSQGFVPHADNPELVIFIGGDGTFLRAVHHYIHGLSSIVFLGIHTGTLGFFCEFNEHDFFDQLANLVSLMKTAHSYPLIELSLQKENSSEIFYAVNEVRIENPFQTFVTRVLIDDIELESFRGTGLIVSSTLGSSAYNKSLGGAIIDHDVVALQLTEMATIQNQAYRALGSPLVLSPKRVITLEGNFEKTIYGYDHLLVNHTTLIDQVRIKLSSKSIRLIHHVKTNFISSIKKNFIGV